MQIVILLYFIYLTLSKFFIDVPPVIDMIIWIAFGAFIIPNTVYTFLQHRKSARRNSNITRRDH